MAVLNPPGALPALARVIFTYLHESGGVREEGELISLFSPHGLAGGESESGRRAVEQTLTVGRSFGLLDRNDNAIGIPTTISDRASSAAASKEAFRVLVTDLIMSNENNGDPWISEAQARTAGARDFTRALSWFLAQDPLGPPMRWTGSDVRSNVQELQSEQLRDLPLEDRAIINDTRWAAFARWAPFCGFCIHGVVSGVGPGLSPIPVRALLGVLRELSPGAHAISDVLIHVRSRLPVIAGGAYRTSLDKTMQQTARTPQLEPSVAQALLLLEDKSLIGTERRGDAGRELLSVEEEKYVTHITINAGKDA